MRRLLPELGSFGAVGAIAFVVDVGVFNLLRITLLPDSPITAKIASVAVATLVAWIGHRSLTFRGRGTHPVPREAVLFAGTNLVGMGIAAGCLGFSHYVLGLTSPLADNIAANVVGLALGTAFRYIVYRTIVFRTPAGANP